MKGYLLMALCAPGPLALADELTIVTSLFKSYPQQQSQWCWAATAQAVVNAIVPADEAFDQCDVVRAPSNFKPPAVYDPLHTGDPCYSDKVGDPGEALVNLLAQSSQDFSYVVKNPAAAISFEDLTSWFRKPDAVPIIFGWRYCPVENYTRGTCDSFREAKHFLLVTGVAYDELSGAQWVDIYDPLPEGDGNPGLDLNLSPDSKGTRFSLQSRRISYAAYNATDEQLVISTDMGVPVVHEDDYLTEKQSPVPLARSTAPPPLTSSTPGDGSRILLGSSLSLADVTGSSRNAARNYVDVLNKRDNSSGAAANALQLGEALPIVALSASRLRKSEGISKERLPLELLDSRSARVLYSATRGDVISDAFILTHARRQIDQDENWMQGGYANTTIVKRVFAQLAERRRTGPYYLVSVPELQIFLLATGSGASTKLILTSNPSTILASYLPDIPTARGGTRKAQAGDDYPAADMLDAVRRAASRQATRRDPSAFMPPFRTKATTR